MQVWNVLHAARWKYGTQKLRKKSPPAHHLTTLSDHIFANEARIDNLKKMLNSNTSFTCSHNMVNFGPLMGEISWTVCGTPAHFNGFLRLAFVTVPTSLNGGQPNFARCLAESWAGTLYNFWGLLFPNGILPGAKFTLRPSLAFSALDQ